MFKSVVPVAGTLTEVSPFHSALSGDGLESWLSSKLAPDLQDLLTEATEGTTCLTAHH